MVSAPGDQSRYGAVYVFRRFAQGGRAGGAAPAAAAGQAPSGNFTWRELTRLSAPVSTRADRFGTTLAADDREIWVGAPGGGGAGQVYVFAGTAEGVLVGPPKIVGPSWVDPVGIGGAVSLRGGVAAVGAAGFNSGSGGVLIYERDGFGAWKEHPILTTPLDEIPAYTGSERRCSGAGKVEVFDCGATNLLAFLPPSKLSAAGQFVEMSSIWGWTDPVTKQEWALLGRADGTTFVDITAPSRPITVADLPLTEGARPSSWREIKVYKDHAFVVSDGSGPHGVQIFDLTRLRSMKPQPSGLPQKVAADAIYRNVASVHNVVINEDSGFMYPVGSNGGGNTCGGGLHMVDIRDPKSPKFVGCHSDTSTGMAKTGYSHDAVCVNYKGPDKRYRGHEICIGSNETAISIADVTDKAKPRTISRSTYPNVAYTHQGWFDETQRYFYVNDEGDEVVGTAKKTRTLIWDLEDLENPAIRQGTSRRRSRHRSQPLHQGHADVPGELPVGPAGAEHHRSAESQRSRLFRHGAVPPEHAGLQRRVECLSVLQERNDHREQHRAGAVHRANGRPVTAAAARPISEFNGYPVMLQRYNRLRVDRLRRRVRSTVS